MNLLFVCSENRLRSPTAERVFADCPGVRAIGAGTNADAATPVSGDLIEWADIVLVMEKSHRNRVAKKFRELLKGKRLVVLDIPDQFAYMQPELIELLKARVARHVRVSAGAGLGWDLAMNRVSAGELVLEPQVAAHAAEMFDVLSDPAIYEFENGPPESAAWLTQRFAKLESRVSADGAERWLNWVVRLPTGSLAGYVQATITRDGTAHVAYELASRYWRRGIGSTAVSAMLNELAQRYGVQTFAATLKERNYRSLALLTKLGFERAGRRGSDEIVMRKRAASAPAA